LNFFRTPFFLPWIYPSLTWRIPCNEKIIYLTFDDGPVPGPTEFVLDTLKKFNAKATFFCIGENVKKYPVIFRRILQEGHEIGNHTFNHLKGWSTNVENYVDNIKLCEGEFLEKNKKSSLLFRPPYGRITRGQIKSLTNFDIIMWDVLTHDYNKSISKQSCSSQSIKATRPGSIVVFHDSVKAEKNMSYALPIFMDHFSNQGYSFEVIKKHV
jgi:peptidoglycan/xylan/chitin deacetylase (PgdA/CDA1 family)